MNDFMPKQSEYESQKTEDLSVDCLKHILYECNDVKSHFSINDKTANTDGWIELLNNHRIDGNVTVQIKTLPQKYYINPKFDCPTSLFAYAQKCPNELVFLFVVNNKDNVAYWKNIDHELLITYKDKTHQKTINLHFTQENRIDYKNIDKTVTLWKSLFEKKKNLILRNVEIKKENEILKSSLEKYQDPALDIDKSFVKKIQRFIDKYNYLLDLEYQFIKQNDFSNTWKVGIVFSNYKPTELTFVLININLGSNGLLIRQIPSLNIRDYIQFSLAFTSFHSNPINENPEKYAFELIVSSTMNILSGNNVLFLTEETAIEYIFDFLEKYGGYLGFIKQDSIYNLSSLEKDLRLQFPDINKMKCIFSFDNIDLTLNVLYQAVEFLHNKSYSKIKRLYPEKGHYDNSGSVSSFYSAKIAYEKLEYFYSRIDYLFNSYMLTCFPLLSNDISFFEDYDLILVNITYKDGSNDLFYQNHNIVLYYLKSSVKIKQKEIVTSLNFESRIFIENGIDFDTSLEEKCYRQNEKISYNNYEFELLRSEGIDMNLFFGDYYIHKMLHKYLHDRFKEYFQNVY